jgi:uncharacterized protein (DUF885 family)
MRPSRLLPLLALVLASCTPVQTPVSPPATPAAAAPASRVKELADAYLEAYLAAFPENATWFSIPGARHDRLTDNSPAGLQAWRDTEDRLAAALADVEPGPPGSPDWLTYGFLQEALEASRGLRVCHNELWPANQMAGWQSNYAQLAAAQPVGAPELRAQALDRWRGLPRFLDQEIANLREGLRRGYSTPKQSVELVVEQLDVLLAAPPEQSPFYSPAERDPDPAFRQAWVELLRDGIYPAARRYRTYVHDEYLPAAREPLAVSANPDGAACYAASLRFYTTLADSPREVFEHGQRAFAAREVKMREIGRQLYGTDDLDEIRRRLGSDPADKLSTRDEILGYSRAAVERAKVAVPQWFGRVPRADVVIRPQPEFAEKGSYSQYLPASDDGSRPGTYEINLYQPEKQHRGDVERTAFHETWPGHHLQLALAQERTQAHPVTRFLYNSGFAEGWARYSETLADEMGLYSSDLNRLSTYASGPMGMVVDTGIHALGWTRQQAIDYALAKQPGNTPERAAKYVDRISVLPGQMTTYGVGELEILALREEARQALGSRFDVREFHDRVLGNGSITLGMLREVIRQWIGEVQGAQ